MIKLHKFNIDDYEELVNMYYNFTKEIYSSRKIGSKYFFYRKVSDWINASYDIILAKDGSKVVGYTLCHVDDMLGLTETVYDCEMAYVKPEYRKGRAAYLMYKNAYAYAKEKGLTITSLGRIENGVDDMMIKHFNLKPMFTLLEG